MAQPSYVAYYGLNSDPFSDLQEPPFIAVGGRQQAVDSVLHLLNYSDDVVFVSGPAGSGKSRLLDQLVRQVEPTIDLALLDVEETGSEKELLWELASQFGLEPERTMSTEALQALIQQHARTQHANGVIPTVAVDDIDDLPAESLSGLGTLLHGGLQQQDGLRLVGLASDIRDVRREAAALGFSAGQLIELPPLTFDDALHLVNGYFQAAGLSAGVPLDEAELNRLYRFSGGRPGAFIDAVRDYMLVAAQKRHRGVRVPWAHVLAGAAVAVVLVIAVMYQTRSGAPASTDERLPSSGNEDAQAEAETGSTTSADLFGSGNTGRMESDRDRAESSGGVMALPDARGGEGDDAPVPQEEVESVRARLDAALAKRANSGAVNGEASGEVDLDARTDTGANKTSDERGGQSTAPEQNDSDVSNVMSPDLFRPDWLLNAPSSSYTIQVVAAREESNVIDFADGSGLPRSEIGYALGELDDRPWYILLYGQFPSTNAARAAIDDLPEAVRRASPWPRPIGDVQAIMAR